MKVKEVVFRCFYKKGQYELRHELMDGSDYGGDDMLMKNCYTPNGDWIGDSRMARLLCVKRGLIYLQKTEPEHCVCSIGFDPKKQKWCGYSHRAGCSFGIGDKLFDEHFGEHDDELRTSEVVDDIPFVQHGEKTIETLEEAKQAAINFAQYVS